MRGEKLNRDGGKPQSVYDEVWFVRVHTLAWKIYDPWKASTVCAMMNYGMSRGVVNRELLLSGKNRYYLLDK